MRAIERAAGEQDPWLPQSYRWWTAVGLLRMGELDQARPHVLILRDRAERRGATRLSASMGFVPITLLSCLEGDWKAGREYSGRGLEASPLNPHLLLLRVLLEYQTGDSAQGESYLARLFEAMGRAGPDQFFASDRASLAIGAIAHITGVPDRLEIAKTVAEAFLESGQSVTPDIAMLVQAGLALLAVETGDQSAAEEHYPYLLGLEQRNTLIWTVSSVDRLLGLLSQTIDNREQASAYFEDALAFCRKAGCRPELAWTCYDYADLLLAAAHGRAPIRSELAVALLEESLSIATELGMRPLMERVIERQELTRSQPAAASAYPDGLTEREVEVLRLIAAGKTNLEIAEELVIAEGTARRHVANIYEKIGAANRAEATRYSLTSGLS